MDRIHPPFPVVPGPGAPRAVPPAFPDGAVIRHQLLQLANIEIIIVIRPPPGLMPVPGREIEARLDAVFTASITKFLYHIPLQGAVHDLMVRQRRIPEAEAVVMLGRQDRGGEAALLQDPCPLPAVQLAGIEDRRRLGAVAPLHIREGIDGEVEERRLPPPVPLHLPTVRHRAEGSQAQFFQSRHMTASFSLPLYSGSAGPSTDTKFTIPWLHYIPGCGIMTFKQ